MPKSPTSKFPSTSLYYLQQYHKPSRLSKTTAQTEGPYSDKRRFSAFSEVQSSSPLLQEFFRTVCHQVLNEVQEARILVTAFPYLVDIAAVCDLMAAEPDSVTFDSDGDNEPMMSRGLPGASVPRLGNTVDVMR